LLDLLIPGLLPGASASSRLPHLERWLARADLVREQPCNAESWLARRFGLEGLPVAPVALAVDEAPQPGHWMRADPVFARVERDSLVLHHAAALAISPDEARALVATLRDHFAADGLEFHVPRPDRWYVRVPAGEVPVTTPLPDAIGQDVFRRLPRGPGKINWAGAITEAQMMLSAHPVNIAREARRQPPVNAVWFWGEGSLPRDVPRAYARVFGSDPFAAGLAHLSGAELAPLPASIAAIAGEASTLVVLDQPLMAAYAGDADAWTRATLELDGQWLAPLGEALSRHAPVRIVLPAARDTCVASVSRASRWRLFRRPRPLSVHA
jgi:hypothetical protein